MKFKLILIILITGGNMRAEYATEIKEVYRKMILYYGDTNKPEDFVSSIMVERNRPKNYYAWENLFDGRVETAWVPQKNHGINEYFYIDVANTERETSSPFYENFQDKPYRVKMQIINGLAKSKRLFYANNRVKEAKLECYDAPIASGQYRSTLIRDPILIGTFSFTFQDTMEPQTRYLNLHPKNYTPGDKSSMSDIFIIICKFTILDIYKGTKYNDTPISEFSLTHVESDADD